MGVWVVGTVTDEQLREVLPAAGVSRPSAPALADVSAELAWWRGTTPDSLFSRSASFPDGWRAEDDAYRLNAFFDGCVDDSERAENLRDAVMDLYPPEGDEGLFAAVTRKAGPFSALAYALGPDAVLRLPGWFGEFFMEADEVRAALPAAEEVLALTGAGRLRALERIRAWMSGLGDAPGHDASELLDGPLRVLRHAARTGRGAAGQVRWY